MERLDRYSLIDRREKIQPMLNGKLEVRSQED